MPARLSERVYHAALYLTAALVLLAAVAITAIRLALPDISRHKGAVEIWAGRHMDKTVVVDSISAEWQGWIPSLMLREVELRSEDGAEKIIGFDAATVEISPFMSLWKWQPVPRRLVISGLNVSVSLLADGSLHVEGINVARPRDQRENEFAKWLFGQDRIEVRETSVTWVDHKHGQDPIHLSGVALAIRTDGARSQVTGELKLPGRYGENMRFALDANGELWSSDWSGEIYAAATRVNPDSWYRKYRRRPLTTAGGSADLELWSRWEQAKPVGVQGRLAYRDFAVLSAGATLNVAEASGRFRAEKLPEKDWHVSLKLARVATENGAWPAANLEFVAPAQTGQRYAFAFDYLKLADLMPFAAGMEFIPASTRQTLATASVGAELLDGLVVYDGRPGLADPLVYDFVFRNLDAGLGAEGPALSKLSGSLRGSGSRAGLTINGSAGRFRIPGLYGNELPFDRIDGALTWARTARGWRLHTDHFSVQNNDLSLAIRGGLEKHEARPSPYLDLVAEIRSRRLENMFRYMPYTEKFRIREWMERSLHAGHVDSAVAVVRGYADEYPFRDNNGRMRGVVNLSQCIVEYSPHWPIVDNADAEIFFHNELMTAQISRGNVFGAEITGATGAIRDLTRRPKTVLLEGNVKGAAKDLELFIGQSPLAGDRIIRYANRSLTAGDFDMELDMSLPIKAPQLQSVIAGTLELDEATLVSDAGGLELEQVNGELSFTRASVFGHGLTALFAGQPVSLSASGAKNNPGKPPAFTVTGRSTDEFIIEQIVERFPGAADFAARLGERMSGATGWQARFVFEQDEEELVQHLAISSDLHGLALDLPKPLWKSTYARRMLTVSKTLQEATPTELSYEGGIHARLQPGRDNGLERVDVSLGNKPRTGPAGAGINLSGYTETLLLDEWLEAIASFATAPGEPGPAPASAGAEHRVVRAGPRHRPVPARAAQEPAPAAGKQEEEAGFFSSADIHIELDTGLLKAFEQSFTGSSLQASRIKGDWRAAIQGEDLAGEIFLPRDPSPENRIAVNLEKLVISKTGDGGSAGEADPKNLPPIRAEITDFTYGDYRLGSMKLATTPTADGLSFEEIGFATPEMTISGSGLWEKPFGRNQSYFDIRVEADKLHKMLDTFAYDADAIKGGKTKISIDAGWEGSPDEFSLDKLAGTFEIRVEKGQLLEVSPAAGRLFGLLSIQSLPRRLTLDFTDLFGKGLAFDKITGNFNIAGGNAYTNDLHLTGPSADVLVSGRTGLSDQDYDQVVTVTPQVADNLPLASALLGPVGIGVGAVLYLAGNMFEGINDNIDNMLSHQYTITGNWHNPKIEKIEKLKESPRDKQVKAPGTTQPAHH